MILSSQLRLSLAVMCAASSAATQCPVLVWSDDFDGASLDASKWESMIGDGCTYGICGWGNNELQYYQAENAEVSGGTLKIEAKEQKGRYKYTSARIRTKGLGGWLQGRFEARIKIPTGQGLWPAFWMLPDQQILGGWPGSGEIDIMENIGSEPATVHGTIHYGPDWPNNQYTGGSLTLPDPDVYHGDFHVFAVEKSEGAIRWLVDGAEYSVKTPADTAQIWPFDQANETFHFLLNVAVGGNWPGSPDDTTQFPQTMEVDYVRVYSEAGENAASFGRLAGPLTVSSNDVGVVYSLLDGIADYRYSWSVPPGANFTDNGNGAIEVSFGEEGGYVTVTATSVLCGGEERRFSLPVDVEPTYAYATDRSYVAPDSADEVATFLQATGTYLEVQDESMVFSQHMGTVVSYTRNGDQQYDNISYESNAFANGEADQYVSKVRRFFMDVHTTEAPSGTQILVQLEDSSTATSANYPTGRHSRYVATIEDSGWKTLGFELLDQPDPNTANVDTIVVLFASNSYTSHLYYFDNFVGGCDVATCGGPGPSPSTSPPTSSPTSPPTQSPVPPTSLGCLIDEAGCEAGGGWTRSGDCDPDACCSCDCTKGQRSQRVCTMG